MAIRRGEIYFVNLNPVQGREQAGQRPILVLSIDTINTTPLVVAVIVGTKGANVPRDYRTNVRVAAADSGLPMETVFLCFQLRSLDPAWFSEKPAGRLTGAKLRQIEETVRYKEQVIDLLGRVTAVSVATMQVIDEMKEQKQPIDH